MSDPKAPKRGNSRDVLASLPSTRPQRRSPKRDAARTPKRASTAPSPRAPTRGAVTTPATKSASTKAGAAKAAGSAATANRTRVKKPRSPEAESRKQPPVAAQGYHPLDSSPVQPPSGAEILASAVQAAGEVAQIGLTVGERLLRAATGRLHKR